MLLDPDSYRALARSSPWRWSDLHFRHRSSWGGEAEAWVARPGHTRVVAADGREDVVTGLPYTRATVSVGGTGPSQEVSLLPHQVTPGYRSDGLVAERPDSWRVDYDDPMWATYAWVAMLDPVELSAGVAVDGCREDQIGDRPVWWARLVAGDGYAPRCGGNCCELLYSEAGLVSDFGDDRVPERMRGRSYPDAYDVALDVETGIVVRLHPVGGPDDAPWLENDVLEVGHWS